MGKVGLGRQIHLANAGESHSHSHLVKTRTNPHQNNSYILDEIQASKKIQRSCPDRVWISIVCTQKSNQTIFSTQNGSRKQEKNIL